MLPNLEQIEDASDLVYQSMQASPQLSWPLLNDRANCEVWVKHENHNPTGAFKVRGGLVYVNRLLAEQPATRGICAATRGNHGQSVAFAASARGLSSVVVVPEGNSPDKNAAMQAFGAELIVHGKDFDIALEHARALAEARDLHFVPSLDVDLIPGVASYALEFLSGVPTLDRIYVPIGLGSGICGVIAARRALGLTTEIVGVVSSQANTYALSFEAGAPIPTNSADTLADGLAVRNPSPDALQVIRREVAGVVTVTDDEVLAAIRHYFTDTHNVAEGAGAAALAALLKADDRSGKSIGVVLSGGNINEALFRQALAAGS
ncbi:MAG: threonine dehydratase [Pseudomonadales bacterium]|nr:threonine dehydratase [Pseudomonadales bacterium]MBO6565089.1 threonine dehydratase [Pseudomonadales bacterium]MBO6596527.1 threonine dehydratase [Pseudomonadales bacterium]MBO6657593.1 threonine dehydratase [Pseudomonadales bacterium]MBO6703222.1 threonine dehydratase [Pseudomonadales bacterium]